MSIYSKAFRFVLGSASLIYNPMKLASHFEKENVKIKLLKHLVHLNSIVKLEKNK